MVRGFLLAVCLMAAMSGADVPFVPLKIKAGNWETVTTTTTTGKMPIPKELLDQMTPEQRKQLEASRANQPPSSTSTDTAQRCLTEEELSMALALADDPGCKTTLTVSTATEMQGAITCKNNGITTNGTMRAEASTPESVKFTYRMTSGNGAGAMTIDANATARWLGPTCPAK